MKKDIHLSASFDQPELLEHMIEKLASRRFDIGYAKMPVPQPWKAIETSTVETYVNGTVEFDCDEDTIIRMPFTTCFIFCCIKGKNDPYDLNWSFSFN